MENQLVRIWLKLRSTANNLNKCSSTNVSEIPIHTDHPRRQLYVTIYEKIAIDFCLQLI